MRKTSSFAAALLVAAAPAANAHDFWLEPEKFSVAAGEEVAVFFTIGHAGAHEAWNLRLEKVAGLNSCLATLCSPQTAIRPDRANERGRALIALAASGTHVLAFESRHSFSELGDAAFNDYAAKEGLTAVLEDRAARRAENEPGREIYSRRAKTLIRVGDGEAGDVSAPAGQTLEIIPLKNPFNLGVGEALPVRVLYEGRPLAGATIDLDDLTDARGPFQTEVTDADGMAAFSVEGAGPFKLMTIWGVPIDGDGRADFKTIFASLTFVLR